MKKLLLLFALFSGSIAAQDLEKHRWKHRLLVIFTSELNSDAVEEQLQILKLAKEALDERKLKVYIISEDKFRVGFSATDQASSGKTIISKPFEILLIGLDGGEKFRSEEVQPVQTFIQLIDQMPMRRQELKGKNKN